MIQSIDLDFINQSIPLLFRTILLPTLCYYCYHLDWKNVDPSTLLQCSLRSRSVYSAEWTECVRQTHVFVHNTIISTLNFKYRNIVKLWSLISINVFLFSVHRYATVSWLTVRSLSLNKHSVLNWRNWSTISGRCQYSVPQCHHVKGLCAANEPRLTNWLCSWGASNWRYYSFLRLFENNFRGADYGHMRLKRASLRYIITWLSNHNI